MYSLSLWPEFDSPQALRDYVKRYGIGPGWTFLTGVVAEVDAIRRKLGFYDSDPAADTECMVPAVASNRDIVASIPGAS